MVWFYYVVVAVFGLIMGSFFNVVIYRVPNDMSLGNRSICPECGKEIHWYDNIPLLSYVLLRGKCRGCGKGISIRYPLVEATTSGLYVLIYWWSRSIAPAQVSAPSGQIVTPELFIGLFMVSVLLIASVVDLTHRIVPNKVMYPSLVMMTALVTAVSLFRGDAYRIAGAFGAALLGAGFLLGAGLLYGLLFMRDRGGVEPPEEEGRDKGTAGRAGQGTDGGPADDEEEDYGPPTGIGFGDVKLIAFTGLALGYFHWYLVIVQVFAGYLLGALSMLPLLILRKKGRKDALPFAPFLAAGAIVALVWGQQIVDFYLKLLS